MLWHEGYHHRQMKLALKTVGRPMNDEDAGPVMWGRLDAQEVSRRRRPNDASERRHGRFGGRGKRLMAGWLRWSACLLFATTGAPGESATFEFRPTLTGGYSHIVEAHGAFSAALRIQLWRFLFVQPEYLVLPAGDHTDHGPAFLVGLSGGNPNALRPFVGLGGGPVNGYQGDDGILYFALGASYPLARQKGVFVQGELRFGLLGESSYSQVTVGIGISR
jgi:hypothetical protein